ncbi:MAG: hypothetical protein ACLP6G_02730 [Terriglobales bacterium]
MVLFSFKTNFFFAKTRDGFEGVQRRGPVKGAVRPRSSETLDREHRWSNAGFQRRGLSGEKMEREKTSAKNTEIDGFSLSAARRTPFKRPSFDGSTAVFSCPLPSRD